MTFFLMYSISVAISSIVFWVMTRYSQTIPGFINSIIGGVLITTFEIMAGMIALNHPILFVGYITRLIFHAFTLRVFGGLKGLLLVVATVGIIILGFMINLGLKLLFGQQLYFY